MRSLAIAIAVLLSFACAQRSVTGTISAGVTYVEARSLAVALGDVVTVAGGTLTWRGEEGVATFFSGSSVALLQRPADAGPTEWPLSAAVRAGDGSGADGWFLPLDAVQILGVAAEETAGEVLLHSPSGERLTIVVPAPPVTGSDQEDASWEIAPLGPAGGVRFFGESQSVLLLDLDLLPLAYPAATEAVDAAAARGGTDNALLLVGTALSQMPLDTALTFEQDGRTLEVKAPYRVHVYQGDAEAVAPGNEVAAVVLLPATFSLYRPLAITWGGVEAMVTFRR